MWTRQCSAITDSAGRFALYNLPAGQAVVHIAASDRYEPKRDSIVVVAAAGSAVDIRIRRCAENIPPFGLRPILYMQCGRIVGNQQLILVP